MKEPTPPGRVSPAPRTTSRRTSRYDCSSNEGAVSTHLFDRPLASEMDDEEESRRPFVSLSMRETQQRVRESVRLAEIR